MTGCFYAVTDNDLKAVMTDPLKMKVVCELAKELPPAPRKSSFLARLFGERGTTWMPEQKPEFFDADKAWHGIHFLLTGTAWEGTGPLAFILHGGTRIEQEPGSDPAHGFTSKEVKEIQNALRAVDPSALYKTADPSAFWDNDIFPDIWKNEPKEKCIGHVTDHLKDLKEFINQAADSNRALIVSLG